MTTKTTRLPKVTSLTTYLTTEGAIEHLNKQGILEDLAGEFVTGELSSTMLVARVESYLGNYYKSGKIDNIQSILLATIKISAIIAQGFAQGLDKIEKEQKGD